MGIRDISDRVLAELERGCSRKEIFSMLAASSPDASGKIAYCIATVPDTGLRKKYLRYNAVLCLLLVIYSVLAAITGLPIKQGEPTIFLLITVVVPIVFAYFIFRFHGGVYRLAGIWFLVDLLESVLLSGTPDGLSVIKLLVLIFVVVLSFLIGIRVFPNLGILGPKKDESGNYKL